MDIYQRIDEYTRGELSIFEDDVYDEMKQAWPNDKEITLYRGINFKTKEAFDNFMEKLNNDGAYVQASASSFSSILGVAQEFSLTSKSYFLDRETMVASGDKNTLGEKVSGYRGVILTTTVPAGAVVDIQKSGKSIEDEFLFAPGEKIKVQIQEVKTYYDLINDGELNPQKEIAAAIKKSQKDSSYLIGEPIVTYLLNNNPEMLDSNLRSLILENDLAIMFKNHKIEEDKDTKVLDQNIYCIAVETKDVSYRTKEKSTEIRFFTHDISEYEISGLISKENRAIIKKLANETMQMVAEIHLENRDRPGVKIKYDTVSHLVPFMSKDYQEMHKKVTQYQMKNKYDQLNERLAEGFKKGNTKDAINQVTSFFNEMIGNFASTDKRLDKEKAYRQGKIEQAQSRRAERIGQIPKLKP